jgi:hypothetical protein
MVNEVFILDERWVKNELLSYFEIIFGAFFIRVLKTELEKLKVKTPENTDFVVALCEYLLHYSTVGFQIEMQRLWYILSEREYFVVLVGS